MRGIDYVVDAAGNKKAVIIDLSIHGDLWEDLFDEVTTREREGEPRETLEEVRRSLGNSDR